MDKDENQAGTRGSVHWDVADTNLTTFELTKTEKKAAEEKAANKARAMRKKAAKNEAAEKEAIAKKKKEAEKLAEANKKEQAKKLAVAKKKEPVAKKKEQAEKLAATKKKEEAKNLAATKKEQAEKLAATKKKEEAEKKKEEAAAEKEKAEKEAASKKKEEDKKKAAAEKEKTEKKVAAKKEKAEKKVVAKEKEEAEKKKSLKEVAQKKDAATAQIVVFDDGKGIIANRKEMQSLATGIMIQKQIINTFVTVLNYEERIRSGGKDKRRHYFPIDAMTAHLLKKENDEAKEYVSFENMINNQMNTSESKKKMKDVSYAFFPVVAEGQYYVIVFNLLKANAEILDNEKDCDYNKYQEVFDSVRLIHNDAHGIVSRRVSNKMED
ncbi:peptidase C48, SUMO/sentrin/Ubl1 [Tanacetum coccineum]